jgi:hypothetical protein
MKTEPGAADLIEIARAAIVAELVPALPEDRRYTALMAANALAIAARDLAAPAGDGAEAARIAELLGDRGPAEGAADPREGSARLAARIRDGAFDEGEPRARLLAHLRATTAARLAVSNPRALKR